MTGKPVETVKVSAFQKMRHQDIAALLKKHGRLRIDSVAGPICDIVPVTNSAKQDTPVMSQAEMDAAIQERAVHLANEMVKDHMRAADDRAAHMAAAMSGKIVSTAMTDILENMHNRFSHAAQGRLVEMAPAVASPMLAAPKSPHVAVAPEPVVSAPEPVTPVIPAPVVAPSQAQGSVTLQSQEKPAIEVPPLPVEKGADAEPANGLGAVPALPDLPSFEDMMAAAAAVEVPKLSIAEQRKAATEDYMRLKAEGKMPLDQIKAMLAKKYPDLA